MSKRENITIVCVIFVKRGNLIAFNQHIFYSLRNVEEYLTFKKYISIQHKEEWNYIIVIFKKYHLYLYNVLG